MSGVPPGFPEHGGDADWRNEIERRLRALETSAHGAFSGDGTNAFLRGGDLRLTDGRIQIFDASGNLLVEFDVNGAAILQADGSVLVQLDGTGIRLNDGSGTKLIDLTTSGLRAYEADGSTLLILDGSKMRFNRADGTRQLEITPAGGMKFYESDGSTVITTLDGSGLQVGSDVVIDSDGLEVIGGMVTPIWPDRASDSAQNQSLTTSYQTIASITFTPPSWVERIYVFVNHHSQMTDASAKNLLSRLSSSAGSTFAGNQFGVGGSGVLSTNSSSISDSVQVDAVDFPYTLNQQARVNSGTNSSNVFTISGIAFGIRVP